MRALGFDSDKQWVLDLVRQCVGDINKVLDELAPGPGTK